MLRQFTRHFRNCDQVNKTNTYHFVFMGYFHTCPLISACMVTIICLFWTCLNSRYKDWYVIRQINKYEHCPFKIKPIVVCSQIIKSFLHYFFFLKQEYFEIPWLRCTLLAGKYWWFRTNINYHYSVSINKIIPRL